MVNFVLIYLYNMF